MSHFIPWPYPRVVAHRGGGILAPENTIAAIGVGREHGFSAVEFDVMLSLDKVPVLMHDPTLERTTRVKGSVYEMTAAELGRLDAGLWHSSHFQGEAVPTFEAAVRYCRENDVWINIEIKPARGHEIQTGTAVARLTTRLYADRIRPGGARANPFDPSLPLFASFERDALFAARAVAPDIPRGYLFDRIPDHWRDELEALACLSLHANQAYLTQAAVREIKEAGYWLFCYTVNEPARARELLNWGVDGFCTDRIDLIGADFA